MHSILAVSQQSQVILDIVFVIIRYDSTHHAQIESKSKGFRGLAQTLHFTPDLQAEVAGVQTLHSLIPSPTWMADMAFLLQEGRQTQGQERSRRGYPPTLPANGTSHSSTAHLKSDTVNIYLTHRHQSRWWHHPQTLNRNVQTDLGWNRIVVFAGDLEASISSIFL